MCSSSSSTLPFPFLVLEFAIKDLGTKLIFPPKRELVVKPFLLMYISITINHDLGTKLFFCVWKGRLSNPFLLMHISVTINQGLGTNLIFAGKGWLSNPLFTYAHNYITSNQYLGTNLIFPGKGSVVKPLFDLFTDRSQSPLTMELLHTAKYLSCLWWCPNLQT